MSSKEDDVLLKVYDQFENFTKRPESFLDAQTALPEGIKSLIKNLYDLSQKDYDSSKFLPELIVDGFDEEQIWQELELRNEEVIPSLIAEVASLLSKKERIRGSLSSLCVAERNVNKERDEESNIADEELSEGDQKFGSELSEDGENPDEEVSGDSEEDQGREESQNSQRVPSVVDDEFFKLGEMEKFLIEEERRGNKAGSESEDENIDYFEDPMEEDDEDPAELNPSYKDFFPPPDSGGKNKISKEVDGNDRLKNVQFALQEMANGSNDKRREDDESGSKSKFEERQERLQRKIKHLESSNLAEKPWQLKGEVSASARPPNSLLEEVLERIKDKAWDDVERKFKPIDTPGEFKKKLVLDQEKSKLSLAEIYEQEYLKKKKELEQNDDEKEEEPETHKEIKKMMSALFLKLDALSNFHYTPKPPVPELRIVSHVPAIEMEEVAPVATSEGKLLAPEEVKAKPKGDVIGKGERTETDKKRERRQKKSRQRERRVARERREKIVEKLNPGLGNKYSKEKAIKMLEKVTQEKNVDLMEESSKKFVKSSKAFFSQLQDEVTSHIKARIGGGTKKKDKKTLSAVK
ncbi:hypothetical protein J437_LFUL014741, partial [Ladona fulva]